MERDRYDQEQDLRTLRDVARERHYVLAGVVRVNLRRLIEKGGHKGSIDLGNPYYIPASSDEYFYKSPNYEYFLKDGVLFGKFEVGRKFMRILPIYETREVKPENVPFEKYGDMYLMEMEGRILHAIDPQKHKAPDPWRYF